jgi:TonB family protein
MARCDSSFLIFQLGLFALRITGCRQEARPFFPGFGGRLPFPFKVWYDPPMRPLLTLLAFGIPTLFAVDMFRTWVGMMETSGGPVPIFLTLNQNSYGISGRLVTGKDKNEVRIEKAEFSGDELAFEVHDNANRLVQFRLKLADMTMRGEAIVQGQSMKVFLSLPSNGGTAPVGPGQGVEKGVFKVGGGVSAPTLVFKVDPDYTEEARAAKLEGTVVLYVEIDVTGTATNLRVQRGLGVGLNEKAIEAVKQWRFKPGQKDGKPVTVAATIEVNFRL